MKKKKITYLMTWLFLIGMSLFSCTQEHPVIPGDEPDPNTDPTWKDTGYISLSVGLEGVIATKAVGESEGIPVEAYFDGLQIIVYDMAHTAVQTYYYDIAYKGVFNNNTPGVTFDESNKTIFLPPIPLQKMAYKIIAVLNPGNLRKESQEVPGMQRYGYTGRDYLTLIQTPKHKYNDLTEAVNFKTAFSGSSIIPNSPADRYAVEMGVNLFMINFWQAVGAGLYPGLYTGWLEDSRRTVNFLMTNADGPLLIEEADIQSTQEDAAKPANRKNIPVERGVAKVGLFKANHITLQGSTGANEKVYAGLSKGAKMTEPVWGTDIINMRSFLIRQTAPTAPSAGGNMETPSTARDFRYAVDPNFEQISLERPGASGADKRKEHFFYIPDDTYLIREWITDSPSGNNLLLDASNRYKYEYVTENTMAADEQYEDVTTRIVLKCKYAPASINIGDSYYYYRGHAFTHAQILHFLTDPSLIPVHQYPELEGLVQVLIDMETREVFWPEEGTITWPLRSVDPNNPPQEPNESKTYRELTYYKDGVSYYTILIRHFNEIESGALMGYGRYGVVRNNVYRICIEDVRGPGHITLPAPKGPDDKGGLIDADVRVAPWRVTSLHFDL
ncbi:hypothetical protein D0T51_07655 [Parabacteroides sp. 52]|uniref:Mfa1 family fimbria major subunit n=1 Tax=unclassified Parabacteroides TaxID=2649774 RepID=UPI0013D53FDA|nr:MULTISPECIES: Mfa1 family fimbria major subunit [unclassified Parabacteroides]MDH6534885.1 hypothetical protein [Parabacteroides sp. PM5-20]NDV55602.1 hypothetical protein [Parabacteroides sp. 52]